MAAYQEWARWRNGQAETLLEGNGCVPVDLSKESKESIGFWMSRFVVECRRKDGTPYPPNSLYNLVTGIQRSLREEQSRNDIMLLDSSDITFAEFRKQLDARMKELTSEGHGIHRQRADPITDSDEKQLWESGVIGTCSAKALSNGVFFYNCKVFGFRRGDEHRNLQTSQFKITTENNEKVLTFYGRSSKNVQGGIRQRRVEPKVVKQFAETVNDRCIVNLFEIYLAHIPSGDFYLRPLPGKPGRPILFSSQKVGINYLS